MITVCVLAWLAFAPPRFTAQRELWRVVPEFAVAPIILLRFERDARGWARCGGAGRGRGAEAASSVLEVHHVEERQVQRRRLLYGVCLKTRKGSVPSTRQ